MGTKGIQEQRIYADGVFVDPDWPRKPSLLCRPVGMCVGEFLRLHRGIKWGCNRRWVHGLVPAKHNNGEAMTWLPFL